VESEALKGLNLGLQGVPFFVVNDVPAVSGAQIPHAFVEVFRQALGQDAPECDVESCKTA
jgi:predicted DsbA family dithiol-disulfide isomerase